MRVRTLAILLIAAALSACSPPASERPTIGPAPTTITTLIPALAAPAATQFNGVMTPTVAPTGAFVARITAGLPPDIVVLPPDMIKLAAAAANAFDAAISHLRTDRWPPAIQDRINALIVATRAFAGDLRVVTIGLAANLLPTWETLFFHDGAALNRAQNDIRAELGLPVVPS